MKEQCSSCTFAKLELVDQAQAGQMICKAMPPTPVAITVPANGQLQVQVLALWPTVKRDDWCGMWDDEIEDLAEKYPQSVVKLNNSM
jgi:hypothetical protein